MPSCSNVSRTHLSAVWRGAGLCGGAQGPGDHRGKLNQTPCYAAPCTHQHQLPGHALAQSRPTCLSWNSAPRTATIIHGTILVPRESRAWCSSALSCRRFHVEATDDLKDSGQFNSEESRKLVAVSAEFCPIAFSQIRSSVARVFANGMLCLACSVTAWSRTRARRASAHRGCCCCASGRTCRSPVKNF